MMSVCRVLWHLRLSKLCFSSDCIFVLNLRHDKVRSVKLSEILLLVYQLAPVKVCLFSPEIFLPHYCPYQPGSTLESYSKQIPGRRLPNTCFVKLISQASGFYQELLQTERGCDRLHGSPDLVCGDIVLHPVAGNCGIRLFHSVNDGTRWVVYGTITPTPKNKDLEDALESKKISQARSKDTALGCYPSTCADLRNVARRLFFDIFSIASFSTTISDLYHKWRIGISSIFLPIPFFQVYLRL